MTKKFAFQIVCIALAVLMPLLLTTSVLLAVPNQFSHTFYGALNEKYDRLYDTKGEKIVLVGGSSVAFGYDSRMIAEYTGMEVVNFGLYAELGTKIMLDLSRGAIEEGDIIILAPELDPQTLSLYFNGSATLKALDDDYGMLSHIAIKNYDSLWGALWDFMNTKLSYFLSGEAPDPEGVYNSRHFNEYGDLAYPRAENKMPGGYDANTMVSLSGTIFDPDFIDYVNDYIKAAEKKGATVYFGWCPINRLSLDLTEAEAVYGSRADFIAGYDGSYAAASRAYDALVQGYLSDGLLQFVEDHFDCDTLGRPQDRILESAYFYDSNFHLNDRGVPLHTARLIDEVCAKLGMESHALADVQGDSYDPDARYEDRYFIYRRLTDGSYAICGTTAAGQTAVALLIPAEFEGEAGTGAVTAIDSGSLRGCLALQTLMFPSTSQIRTLAAGALETSTETATAAIDEIYFYCDGTDLTLGDSAESASLWVGADVYDSYTDNPSFTPVSAKLFETPVSEAELAEVIGVELDQEEDPRTAERFMDEYFIYRWLPDGSYTVCGTTPAGKTADLLVLPLTFTSELGEGPVKGLDAYAFSGTTDLRYLVVGAASPLSSIANNAFNGSSIIGLYLYIPETQIQGVTPVLAGGTRPGFTIYVPPAALQAYENDYYWSTLAGYYAANSLSEDDLLAVPPAVDTPMDPLLKTLYILLAVGVAAVLFSRLISYLDKQADKKNHSLNQT
ncbi:MAG: hypothetical protein WDA00_06495 [Eubacteriales bacterium]